MLAAVEICREIGAAGAFKPYRSREVMPGSLGRSDMIDFIRNAVSNLSGPSNSR